MSNQIITDAVSGTRRIYYSYGVRHKGFRFKGKNSTITYAYSLPQSAKMTYDWIMQKMMNETLEDNLNVTVNVGFTLQNPKDTPNLKLARELAKTRMVEKALAVEYTVSEVEVHKTKIYIGMQRVRSPGEDLNGLPAYLSLQFEKGNADEMKAYKLVSTNFNY
jgi:hypothetical protein